MPSRINEFARKDFRGFTRGEKDGEGMAVVASLGALDADDEIILPGSLANPGKKVKILSQHGRTDSIGFGIGRCKEEGGQILMEFDLDIEGEVAGRHYRGVKAMGEDQEWSVGITILEAAWVQKDGKHIRELRKIRINEVSTVVRGSQPGTRTTNIKGAAEEGALQARVAELDGKVKALEAGVKELQIALRAASTPPDPKPDPPDPAAPTPAEARKADGGDHDAIPELPASLLAAINALFKETT